MIGSATETDFILQIMRLDKWNSTYKKGLMQRETHSFKFKKRLWITYLRDFQIGSN